MSSNNQSDRPGGPVRLPTEAVPLVGGVIPIAGAVDEVRGAPVASTTAEVRPVEGRRMRMTRTKRGFQTWKRRFFKHSRRFTRNFVEGIPMKALYEFVGTFLLLTIGIAGGYVYPDNLFNCALIWGVAVAVCITCTQEASGGHINPSYTLAFAIFRNFEKKKIIPYLLAQFSAGGVAAIAVQYWQGKVIEEKKTELIAKGLETSGPLIEMLVCNPDMSIEGSGRWLIGEALACFFSCWLVATLTDSNWKYSSIARPFVLGAGVFLDVAVSGKHCLALNPARDFLPRFVAAHSYGWEKAFFTSIYPLIPLFGPLIINCATFFFYDLFCSPVERHANTSNVSNASNASDGYETDDSVESVNGDIETANGETLPARAVVEPYRTPEQPRPGNSVSGPAVAGIELGDLPGR